jgi:hypothetical protein
MHAQRGIGIPRYRGCHPGRGLFVGAVAAERLGELGLLGSREPGVHPALEVDLRVHQLVLAGDRHVLPGAHRERPGPGKRAASRAYRAPAPSALPWANLLRAKNPVPITPSTRQWRQAAATAAAPDEKENR